MPLRSNRSWQRVGGRLPQTIGEVVYDALVKS